MIFMKKPSHEHKKKQDIPSVEALNTCEGAAHVGMRYDSHDDNQPAQRLVPITYGIDGQEGNNKCENRVSDQFISPVFV